RRRLLGDGAHDPDPRHGNLARHPRLGLRPARHLRHPRLCRVHAVLRALGPVPDPEPPDPAGADGPPLRAAAVARGHRADEPHERRDRPLGAVDLGRPGRVLGEPGLDAPGGSQARVGSDHPDRLRLPALDGPARLGGTPRGAALDLRLRSRPLLLHRREPLPDLASQLPMTAAQEARLALVGWNFREAAESVRERVAFTPDEVREALSALLRSGVIAEGVIVSTCHRSEIYGYFREDPATEKLTLVLSEWRGLDHALLTGNSFRRLGADAVRHLFRVAAGLDSIALGESEILGQVRTALRLASET